MLLVKWTILGLLLLPVAETVVFILVVLIFGWLWAVFLFIATSVAGFDILRRKGRGDFNRFLAAVKLGGVRAIHLNTPGLGPLLGGILLVFPGFITDIVGALLFIPPLRRWAAASIGRKLKQQRAQRNPSLIELEPNQWREIPDMTRAGNRP
jgi:UPF0716 protein FxsA